MPQIVAMDVFREMRSGAAGERAHARAS